jgi:uncharacterized protein YdeI (YjbR/CyaY-like superfamily)
MEEFLAHNRTEWRNWLAENHLTSKGVWLISYKKTSGKPHISYAEGVEEALCFGWIDSIARTVDTEKSKLYYSPRKPKSNWSKLNKERVEKLTAANMIMEAGHKMIDLAKKTGTWSALDGVSNLEIPEDLKAALQTFENAEKYFTAFPPSVKKGILEWVLNAKTTETRMKRIIETASLANDNKRANQYVKKMQ